MGKRRILASLILFALLTACAPTPDPYANDYAQVDLSLLESGVVRVRYTGDGESRVKLHLTKTDGTDYNYDLNTAGEWEQFTLTEGEGSIPCGFWKMCRKAVICRFLSVS